MKVPPSHPADASSQRPINFETEIESIPLRGTLPTGLRGTLVRNGPNPLLPDPKAHLFFGDGMLHAFRIENGQVSYRNRWVRTAQWEYERRTGKNATEGFSLPSPTKGIKDDGVANTNVIHHAGRMLALEEAHLPIAMELDTLGTLGPDDFGGGLHGPFTAHPKTDPETGELIFFGYGTPMPLSAGMSFGVISPRGKVTRFERFKAPYASMVHDFAVTRGHVVFPITPLTASLKRALTKKPPFAWEPDHGTRVGIMSRQSSTADLVWWTGPACYVFHVMNAWEADGHVFVDVMRFDKPPLFTFPDGKPAGGPREPATLVRWAFDLGNPRGEFTQTVLSETTGEYPRIDERRAGLPYRHGWFSGNSPGADGQLRLHSSLVHIDHSTPGVDLYTFDEPDSVSEPVFVASAADAPEGEGWVLATVWRGATDTSDLVVFDAQRLSAGPICVASLPHRVPAGFHGNWFTASDVTPRS